MASKYDPYVDSCLFAFSDPHKRIYDFDFPPNFNIKKFSERVRFRGYLWTVSQDGGRIVVFRHS